MTRMVAHFKCNMYHSAIFLSSVLVIVCYAQQTTPTTSTGKPTTQNSQANPSYTTNNSFNTVLIIAGVVLGFVILVAGYALCRRRNAIQQFPALDSIPQPYDLNSHKDINYDPFTPTYTANTTIIQQTQESPEDHWAPSVMFSNSSNQISSNSYLNNNDFSVGVGHSAESIAEQERDKLEIDKFNNPPDASERVDSEFDIKKQKMAPENDNAKPAPSNQNIETPSVITEFPSSTT